MYVHIYIYIYIYIYVCDVQYTMRYTTKGGIEKVWQEAKFLTGY